MGLYFKDMYRIPRHRSLVYILAILSIALVAAALIMVRDEVNQTTVALTLLLVVLFVATFLGSRPALVASVVGMLLFNYFFLPPYGTFTIADPQNWAALSAFLVTAMTAGWLSARARERATEAEQKGREVARLYAELQGAFEQASHAEALRQSERLKSALLDAVTHDIRTPLTSIKASVTTLLDERRRAAPRHTPVRLDDDERQEMLEIIDEEADRLNRFVEGMIELARIEAGELYLRRRWGVIDEIIGAALGRAEKIMRHHRVTVQIEPELPTVLVDPRAVTEVVYTLMDNAAKYSPQGSTILITAKRAPRDDGTPAEAMQLAIEDEGSGIPVHLRERVFDKFFRATQIELYGSDADNYQPTGTGMGLSIARGIVEAHAGSIWIEDAHVGARGTRVVFTLPVEDEPARDRAPQPLEPEMRVPRRDDDVW